MIWSLISYMFAAALTLSGAGLIVYIVPELQAHRALEREGVTLEVVPKSCEEFTVSERDSSNRSHNYFKAKYVFRYEVDGASYDGQEAVYGRCPKAGETIKLRYHRDEPGAAQIASSMKNTYVDLTFGIFFGGVLVVMGLALAADTRAKRHSEE